MVQLIWRGGGQQADCAGQRCNPQVGLVRLGLGCTAVYMVDSSAAANEGAGTVSEATSASVTGTTVTTMTAAPEEGR
jgi:hypothetical protein